MGFFSSIADAVSDGFHAVVSPVVEPIKNIGGGLLENVPGVGGAASGLYKTSLDALTLNLGAAQQDLKGISPEQRKAASSAILSAAVGVPPIEGLSDMLGGINGLPTGALPGLNLQEGSSNWKGSSSLASPTPLPQKNSGSNIGMYLIGGAVVIGAIILIRRKK